MALNPEDLRLDVYAPLSHKTVLARDDAGLAPTWVPKSQHRRLTAYKVLAAYRDNCARFFRPTSIDPDEDVGQTREYGDAGLLIERTIAGVIGDDWQITVDGADDDLPDEPDLPDRPSDLDADASDIETRIHTIRQARWDEQATAMVDEWEQAWQTQPALQARQDWLRDWVVDEFFAGKLEEGEGDAVGLGDGIYVLMPRGGGRPPSVTVYDPGLYFPVLDDDASGGEYPEKVHIAWEFVDERGKRFVRRLTFELMSLNGALYDPETGDYPRDANGTVVHAAPGDATTADGVIVRRYPWADPDGPESNVTCLYTDATWPFEALGKRAVDDFAPNQAVYGTLDDGRIANRADLQIDFVPVVHVPNTPATRDHHGRSILLLVAQVLDDVHDSDTDRQKARDLAAVPLMHLAGGQIGSDAGPFNAGYQQTPAGVPVEYANAQYGQTHAGYPYDSRPFSATKTVHHGGVIESPMGSSMDVLDVTGGLEQLRAETMSLLDRLSVNSRVSAEVLGRVKASEVPSGVALALAFGPFRQLVSSLRLVREQKYALLLKFVQRLAQQSGALEPGPNPAARIEFGSYLPADLRGVIEDVARLLTAHAISRRTGLQLLVAAGMTIEDATAELERIDREDTSGAFDVFRATGSEELAADHLGLDLPDPPAAPTIGGNPIPTLPPVPTPPPPGGP